MYFPRRPILAHMIQDQKQINIDALPEKVFGLIETMPNKFPVYKILESKPFFFMRIIFVDGLRAAIKAVSVERPNDYRYSLRRAIEP